jgi:hypothetical protein
MIRTVRFGGGGGFSFAKEGMRGCVFVHLVAPLLAARQNVAPNCSRATVMAIRSLSVRVAQYASNCAAFICTQYLSICIVYNINFMLLRIC